MASLIRLNSLKGITSVSLSLMPFNARFDLQKSNDNDQKIHQLGRERVEIT